MLKPAEHEFLQEYFASLDPEEVPEEVTVRAGIAGNAAMAEDLLELYLSGKKWAGSGLVEDYVQAGDALPKEDDYWIILDTKEVPRCIVRVKKTETHLFKDIPEAIAIAEGEGDLSLAYWRKAHAEFFAPYLEMLEIDDIESAEVITEFFEMVYVDESGGTSN